MAKILPIIAAVLAAAVFLKIDCSALVSGENNEISFGYFADEKGLTIYINNYDENSGYDFSINGGNNFITISGINGIHFANMPEGTYQICVMKTGDISTLTDVSTFVLDRSDDNEASIKISCEGLRENEYKNGGLRVTVENYLPGREYMLSYDGGVKWYRIKEKTTEFRGLYSGYYNVCIRSPENPRYSSENVKVYVPPKALNGKKFISAPLIMQLPDLPTGCEVTSLAMAINFCSIGVSNTVLADYYLDKGEYRAVDFRRKFVGDPREANAYGCYAGVIVNCAEKFFKSVPNRNFDVVNMTGSDPSRLYAYLEMGYPVIVWATAKMRPSSEGARWIDRETGEIVTWKGNEHCLLLIGYDNTLGRVYVNDPQLGTVAYDKRLFEKRYREMESQAVVIVETTEK